MSGAKKIENRSWKPPESLINGYVALHAGKCFDYIGAYIVEQRFGIRITEATSDQGAIIAVARIEKVVTQSSDPWFYGPYGWVLSDVTPIAPIACRGAQRLWSLSADLHERVLDAYTTARRQQREVKGQFVS